MCKVVSRDGTTAPCEKTGGCPATVPGCCTAGGGFTGVRTNDAPDAGSRL
jgi:hypothetical protein